jgi:hypothetical protein
MRVNASERSRCSTATNTELGTLHAGTQKEFTLSLLGTSLPLCRQARGDEVTRATADPDPRRHGRNALRREMW